MQTYCSWHYPKTIDVAKHTQVRCDYLIYKAETKAKSHRQGGLGESTDRKYSLHRSVIESPYNIAKSISIITRYLYAYVSRTFFLFQLDGIGGGSATTGACDIYIQGRGTDRGTFHYIGETTSMGRGYTSLYSPFQNANRTQRAMISTVIKSQPGSEPEGGSALFVIESRKNNR